MAVNHKVTLQKLPAKNQTELPLIVIVGPTASGKTGLSIKLAQKYNGEIICADSRTVYRNMDIGTAKPTREEQSSVPHWGLDLVDPGERFSAFDFKKYATDKITQIRQRGSIPFIVGGTGLYVDSVIFDYNFGGSTDSSLRNKLNNQNIDELHKYCIKHNIKLPENKLNKRYVIRAIEKNISGNTEDVRRREPIEDCLVVGIETDRDVLRKRINDRIEQFFENNVVKEAKMLGKIYGWNNEAMTGNIYPIINQYLSKEITLTEAKQKAFYNDWHLAKRQLTWLHRNKFIKWMSLGEAEHFLSHEIARMQKM